MQRKILHIFTVTLLSICLIEANAYAQEAGEDDLPIKPETTVLEKDSTANEESTVEEPKSDMLTPVIVTPNSKGRNLLAPENESNAQKPSIKPTPITNGDKAKQEESTPNLRFNLLYYLFYKVKVGSSSSTSN